MLFSRTHTRTRNVPYTGVCLCFRGCLVPDLHVTQEVSLSDGVSAVGDVLAVFNTTIVSEDRYLRSLESLLLVFGGSWNDGATLTLFPSPPQ